MPKPRGNGWTFSSWDWDERLTTVLWGNVDVKRLRAEGKWRDLKTKLMSAWRAEATKVLVGKKDYATRYKAGISIQATDDQIQFVVSGFEAMKIEMGWGPPSSGTYEDGLGEWKSGPARDMRGFLLTNPDGVTEDGIKYKRLMMGFWKSVPELADEARTMMVNQQMASRSTSYRVAAHLRNKLNSLRPGPQPNASKRGYGGDQLSADWDRYLPKAKYGKDRAHSSPLLSRAFKFRKPDQTTGIGTIRTITDSDEQLNSKRWFTRGVRPNYILKKAQPRFIEIVISAIGGAEE